MGLQTAMRSTAHFGDAVRNDPDACRCKNATAGDGTVWKRRGCAVRSMVMVVTGTPPGTPPHFFSPVHPSNPAEPMQLRLRAAARIGAVQSRGVACEGRIGVGTASDTILKADSGGTISGDVGGEATG